MGNCYCSLCAPQVPLNRLQRCSAVALCGHGTRPLSVLHRACGSHVAVGRITAPFPAGVQLQSQQAGRHHLQRPQLLLPMWQSRGVDGDRRPHEHSVVCVREGAGQDITLRCRQRGEVVVLCCRLCCCEFAWGWRLGVGCARAFHPCPVHSFTAVLQTCTFHRQKGMQ